MATYKAVQIPAAGAAFEFVERQVPEPGPRMVRIRVEACGVCHSDSLAKGGGFPGLNYPIVPGHEVAGIIDAVGASEAGAARWSRLVRGQLRNL